MLLGIRWGSLTTKIIVWSFVPTVGILAAVALVTFSAYQQVTEALVIQRDRELTRLSADQLGTQLTTYAERLDGLVRAPDFYEGDSEAQHDALRRAGSRLAVFDGGVVLLDTFGEVVVAEPGLAEGAGRDWSDHPCYREVLRARVFGSSSPIFSNIVAGRAPGAAAVCVAAPVLGEQGELLGTLVGLFGIGESRSFRADIGRLNVAQGGSVYLVDGDGRALYHSDPSVVGSSLSAQPVVQRALAGEADAIRTRDAAGADIVASFASVPGTPWALVIEESWSELTRASQGYQRFLLVLMALGVVVPIAFVTVGVRQITRPISELIDAAQEVASGKFGRTITVRTGDEIEELAEQFNLMSAHLQESYANLERRVADRTKELAALNAIAVTVAQSLDLDEILDDALGKTIDVMGIEAGGVYLLDEQSGLLNLVAHRGFSSELAAEVDALQMGEGFSGRVAETGEPLVVDDVSADPRLTRTAVRKEGLRSVAIAPLSTKGRVVGTLFAQARSHRDFTEQEVQLLSSIGHQIALAVENVRLFENEQRRAEQFEVISEVGRRVTSILSTDELLDQIVLLIHEAFGYDTVEIGLVEGDDLVFTAGIDRDLAPPFQGFSIPVGEGVTGWVAANGELLVVPDVTQEPRFIMVTDTNAQSELAVPIAVGGRTIGVLNVQSQELDAFDASDLAVIQSLADQAAIAIENSRLFLAEQRRSEQFRVISEVGRHITSILDTDELLREMVSLLKQTFGYDLITIGLIEGGTLVFKAGEKTRWREAQFRPPPVKVGGRGITAWVAETGEPLLVDDVEQDVRYLLWPEVAETRSELAVPLRTKGVVIGVLNVESDRPSAFDESDMEVLQSLANQAAIAIENARNYERAQRAAVLEERARLARELHDAVTQTLFSASLIAEALPALWEVDQSEGRELLGTLRQLSRGALAEMRTLLMELRPAALAESSLDDLLRQLADAATGRTGATVDVTVEGPCALPAAVHAAIYRIAQEALNNVVKHAQAGRVTVTLRCEPPAAEAGDVGRVELQVCDDGRGFDPTCIPPESLGLEIMQERTEAIGASLTLDTELDCGTRVTVVWTDV